MEELKNQPATGQIIILLYNHYTQGVTTRISPVFDIGTISVTQYNKIVLDQIKNWSLEYIKRNTDIKRT